LGYTPTADIDMAYSNIATAELERLQTHSPKFHCNHKLEQHEQALKAVLVKIPQSIN